MPSTIVLNSNNVVQDGNNNQLVYNFPNSVSFPNHDIAVQSIDMYYSWQNINANPLNNNTFFYWWVQYGSGGSSVITAFPVVLPNGLYNIVDINNYLQSVMIANGTYLINAVGENVYYLEMILNPSLYSVQINGFALPTTLPAGWSLPSNYPSGAIFTNFVFAPSFALNVPANTSFTSNNFYKIIGFPQNFNSSNSPTGNQTPNYSSYTFTSSQFGLAPQVQPNPVIYLASTNIDNKYAKPSTILYSVTPNVSFGALINIVPPQFAWNKLLQGNYNQLRIQILGSDFSPIKLLDPNMTIVLVIRDRSLIIPKSIRDSQASITDKNKNRQIRVTI